MGNDEREVEISLGKRVSRKLHLHENEISMRCCIVPYIAIGWFGVRNAQEDGDGFFDVKFVFWVKRVEHLSSLHRHVVAADNA